MLTVQWRRRDSAGKLAYALWVFAPEEESASAVASSAMGKATEDCGTDGWTRRAGFLLPTARANGQT